MLRRRVRSPAAAVNVLSAVWRRITRLARLAMVLLVSGLIIGPVLALSGQNEFAAVAALSPFVGLLLFLFALRNPRNLVAIASVFGLLGIPKNRGVIFRTIFRWAALYLAAVAAVSIFLYLVPVSRSPWLVLPLVATVLLLLLLSAGRALGGTIKFLLVSLIVGISIAFFFSGEGRGRAAEAAAHTVEAPIPAPPSVESIREIVRIPLLGEGTLSEVSLRSGTIPPRWYYYFEGPPGARIHFDDGTVSLITQSVGLKNGAGRFTGPKGGEVVVRAYPPSK